MTKYTSFKPSNPDAVVDATPTASVPDHIADLMTSEDMEASKGGGMRLPYVRINNTTGKFMVSPVNDVEYSEVDTLIVTLLNVKYGRRLWPGGKPTKGTKPLCASFNGTKGHGDPGGSCKECIKSQKSGTARAECKPEFVATFFDEDFNGGNEYSFTFKGSGFMPWVNAQRELQKTGCPHAWRIEIKIAQVEGESYYEPVLTVLTDKEKHKDYMLTVEEFKTRQGLFKIYKEDKDIKESLDDVNEANADVVPDGTDDDLPF